MTEQMFMTREQAAQVAGVSLDTIRRAINAGKLRAKRLGGTPSKPAGKYLTTREALTEWFDGLAAA